MNYYGDDRELIEESEEDQLFWDDFHERNENMKDYCQRGNYE